MFDRLSNSWELAKASMQVLRSDKELLVFPLISALGAIVVMITFIVPFAASGIMQAMVEASERGGRATASVSSDAWLPSIILMFLFYVVTYFVTFFCNTALVGAAMIRLRGGDPTVADGFRIASQRIGNIFGYAVISATVGMVLRAISERGGIIGQIVSSMLGFGWTVATFLVVPILAVENIGPVDAVKRSVDLLKKTWGENLVANIGISAVFGWIIAGFILLVFMPLLFVAITAQNGAFILAVVIVGIGGLVVIGLISSALTGIYQAALYHYAQDGEVGGDFDSAVIRQAFKPKRQAS
ncbi:MAG: hypothetical protein HXY40_12015 [Chloroflexi bacterium]|nr:hypothetical protein [Chloroflexota bacterium]